MHSFFAYGYKFAPWIGVLFVAGLAVRAASPTVERLRDISFSFWLAAALLASVPLGWVFGFIVVRFLFFWVGRIFNGYFFRKDDWVRILVGPYRGRVFRVYEVWAQRGQVRVEIDEQSRKEVTDVFSEAEICRAKNPEPAAPPNEDTAVPPNSSGGTGECG